MITFHIIEETKIGSFRKLVLLKVSQVLGQAVLVDKTVNFLYFYYCSLAVLQTLILLVHLDPFNTFQLAGGADPLPSSVVGPHTEGRTPTSLQDLIPIFPTQSGPQEV